jgi:hypothetical protein
MSDILVGKYFIGYFHDDGIVEAAIDDSHYLVRHDTEWNGAPVPESRSVVSLSDMIGGADLGPEERMPWLFFDSAEQRKKYRDWIKERPDVDPEKPRIVPMRRDRH